MNEEKQVPEPEGDPNREQDKQTPVVEEPLKTTDIYVDEHPPYPWTKLPPRES